MSIPGAICDELGRSLRQIRRHPGISVLVVLVLSVCIGANAAVFSVVKTALLDPYGYPGSDRVVNIGMVWEKGPWGAQVQEISPRTYLDIAETARCFEAIGFVDGSARADLQLGDRTERVVVGKVTPGIWGVARVPPRLGRVFDAESVRQGQSHVVVLSYELWTRAFAGQPSVLGRQLRLNDTSFEVIGVMPPDFRLVDNTSQIWLPKDFSDREKSEEARGNNAFQALGRLRDGVSARQAAHELSALHAAFLEQHPASRELSERLGATYGVAKLGEWVGFRSSAPMLLTVQAAALLILLIGCLNVAGVLLVRSRRRFSELALRRAVGATRGRIAAQLLLETLTLYGIGAAAGLLIGKAGVAVMPRLLDSGEWLRYGRPLALDGAVVFVALVASLVIGLIAGCVPALAATSSGAASALRLARQSTRRTPHWKWAQGAHVAAQLAVCTVLLVAAIATLGNLRGLLNRGFGVATTDRLVARLALPAYRYGQPQYTPGLGDVDTGSRARAFKEQALQRIRAIPGVEGATFANRVALSREHMKFGFGVAGYSPQPGELVASIPYGVGPDYFAVVGTPVLKGRALALTDTTGSQPVVVISEGIARQYLQGREPIGSSIDFFGRRWTVVGVAADSLDIPMSMADAHSLYFPHTQWSGRLISDEVSFVVRTRAAHQVGRATRAALLSLDPQLDLQISSMKELQRRAIVTRRVPAGVTTFFSVIAILLTALGVFGLLANSVSERTSEIGVRVALGASRASVLRLVLSWAGWLSAVGVAVGIVAAFYLCRLFGSSLTEVNATAPGSFALAASVVLGVALVSAYGPARRATRIDPTVALRCE
jgi:putative ABC transport system permease protein